MKQPLQLNQLPKSIQIIGGLKCLTFRMIPDSWTRHILKDSRGAKVADYDSCMLLSYIVGWYNPTPVYDPSTNAAIGYTKRFEKDAPLILNITVKRALNMAENTATKCFKHLEELGLIQCDYRTISYFDGVRNVVHNNQRFVHINADLIARISVETLYENPYPQDVPTVSENDNSGDTPRNKMMTGSASDVPIYNIDTNILLTDTINSISISENSNSDPIKEEKDTPKDPKKEEETIPPPPTPSPTKPEKYDMRRIATAIDEVHKAKAASANMLHNPIDWAVKKPTKFGQLKKILECLNSRYKEWQKKTGVEKPVDMDTETAIHRTKVYTEAAFDYYQEIHKQMNNSLVIFGIDFMLGKFDKVIAFKENKSHTKVKEKVEQTPKAYKFN